jgi:Ca2+-binding RTX toxin-like protein
MALIFGARTDRLINASDGVTNDADTIVGDSESESIYGRGGNDVLKGGGGADRLDGGDGVDTAVYIDSDVGVQVNLTTGLGSGGTATGDRLYDIENVTGSEHHDSLFGDANDNTLRGEGGDDLLKGGGGADHLYGGEGHDRLDIDGIGDYLDGGDGNDTAYFNIGDEPVYLHGFIVDLSTGHFGGRWFGPAPDDRPQNIVNVENVSGSERGEEIRGDDADNMLWGNGGGDTLRGRGGSDYIDGGLGRDNIIGDGGDDLLAGGADADLFYFGSIVSRFATVEPGHFGHDIISDFEDGLDKIVVDDTISYATIRTGMQQVGDDVVITLNATSSITLDNTWLYSISSADFLFE